MCGVRKDSRHILWGFITNSSPVDVSNPRDGAPRAPLSQRMKRAPVHANQLVGLSVRLARSQTQSTPSVVSLRAAAGAGAADASAPSFFGGVERAEEAEEEHGHHQAQGTSHLSYVQGGGSCLTDAAVTDISLVSSNCCSWASPTWLPTLPSPWGFYLQ